MSKNETIKFLSHRIEAMQGEIDKLSRKKLKETINIEYADIQEDLIQFYEIDIDNCRMSNLDWIREMALLICTNHYKYQVLSEIEQYKTIRKNL
jgi:hypothetical protein